MSLWPARVSVVVGVALAAVGAAGRDARAQAWVDGQGAIDLDLDYNLAVSDKVVAEGDTADFPDAGSTVHQLTLGAEYVPIERLAITASLPFALLKFTGDRDNIGYAHPGGGEYDDGDYHATLTDLRFGARYQILEEPVALSPHLAFSIPVADYETVGNTVAGRGLLAAHIGLGVGRMIGTSTYVHLLYEFTLAEKYDRTAVTEEYGQNRSDLSLTVGHKLLKQRLDLHVGASARIAHGGVSFDEFDMLPSDAQLYHDPLLAEDVVLAGLGVGYQLTDKVAVSLAGRLFVTGANTQNASVLALGLSWSPR